MHMMKFLTWLYTSENGLMTQTAAIGTALSVTCTVSNQQFDINAAFWALLPLSAIWHFATEQRKRNQFRLAAVFN